MMMSSMSSHISVLQACRSLPSLSSSFRHLSLSSSVLAEKLTSVEIPKKPNTPWINFYSKNLPAFKKTFPSVNTPELMRKISNEWSKVPDKDKSKLQEFYQKEKESYAVQLAKVPQEHLDNVKAAKKSKQMEKQSKIIEKQTKLLEKQTVQDKKSAESELKHLLTSLNKPKRPLSTYFLFCMDRRPQLADTLSNIEKVKKMAEEWRQATRQTKEFYEKKNKGMVEQYEKDLERWSMKMQDEGRNEEIAMAQMRVVKTRKTAKDQAL